MTSPIKGPGGGTRASTTYGAVGNNPDNKKNLTPTALSLKSDSDFFDREIGQPGGPRPQRVQSPKVAPAPSQQVPSSARDFSKEELLQTLTLLENLADSGFELNIAGREILNTKHDNQISLEELGKGYKRLKELLEKPPEKGLTELRRLDKSWKVLGSKDVNPAMIEFHYERLLKAAEFMLRHGGDIARLDEDKKLISRNDIEKMWE